jgi:hypothetical protein
MPSDGSACPSGGTHPTDSRLLNRRRDGFRLFRSLEDTRTTHTSKSGSSRLTSAVISTFDMRRWPRAQPVGSRLNGGVRLRFGYERLLHKTRSGPMTVLPNKWHKTIPDPLLVFRVSGQVLRKETFFVKEPP